MAANGCGIHSGTLKIWCEFRRGVGFVSWLYEALICTRIPPNIKAIHQKKVWCISKVAMGNDVSARHGCPFAGRSDLALDLYEGG